MEALGSIGSFFGSPAGQGIGKLASLGTTGLGLYSNISAENQRGDELNYLKNSQNALTNLTPAQLSAKVSQAQQPLNSALVQGISNQVSGNLASQGLSEAPGIQASTLAQALAPYQQQNQQAALQLVMQQLGLPIEYAQALLRNSPGQSNLSPILSTLFKGNAGTPATGQGFQTSFPPDDSQTAPQDTPFDIGNLFNSATA